MESHIRLERALNTVLTATTTNLKTTTTVLTNTTALLTATNTLLTDAELGASFLCVTGCVVCSHFTSKKNSKDSGRCLLHYSTHANPQVAVSRILVRTS
jgi:hypothetical protein